MTDSTPVSRRALIRTIAASALGSPLIGCGTILYPERRGQPAGDFDWKVVGLDAIGLLFFFVPGVVAFAVDFSNGTIYLPPEECAGQIEATSEQLTEVSLPGDQMDVVTIEKAVSARTKKSVRLEPGKYQTHKLVNLAQFWQVRDRCQTS